MKKTPYVFILILMLSLISFADSRFTVSLSGNLLSPSDTDFKDIYGTSILYPEVKAGVKLFNGLYVWGAYGFFKKTGETPVLAIEATTTQNILSFGAGYLIDLSEKLSLDLAAGLSSISYKEEALGLEISGDKMGFRIDGGIIYSILKGFFVKLSAGYFGAQDNVNGADIKLGGITAGLGLGITF